MHHCHLLAGVQPRRQQDMTPLGPSVVEDLYPLLARHMCVLILAAAATEAADEACLLLLAWAAMPLSWAVVSCLHRDDSTLVPTEHQVQCV